MYQYILVIIIVIFIIILYQIYINSNKELMTCDLNQTNPITQSNTQSNIKPDPNQSDNDYKYSPDDVYQDNTTCVEGTRGCIIACTKSTGLFDDACFRQCIKTTFIC